MGCVPHLFFSLRLRKCNDDSPLEKVFSPPQWRYPEKNGEKKIIFFWAGDGGGGGFFFWVRRQSVNKEGEKRRKKNPKQSLPGWLWYPLYLNIFRPYLPGLFFSRAKKYTFGSLDRAQFPPPVSPAKQKKYPPARSFLSLNLIRPTIAQPPFPTLVILLLPRRPGVDLPPVSRRIRERKRSFNFIPGGKIGGRREREKFSAFLRSQQGQFSVS